MGTNPYSQDDFTKASEYLRLPIFCCPNTRFHSPLNFRMGYDCVAGRNEELKTVLRKLLRNLVSFSPKN